MRLKIFSHQNPINNSKAKVLNNSIKNLKGKLAEKIEKNCDFETVPNLIYKTQNGRIGESKIIYVEDINSLPTPLFDGYDLDMYFSTHRILALLTSRGCYWNKCTFCTLCSTYGSIYRKRKINLVIDDLKTLIQKYKCRYFIFDDESISPKRLNLLSKEIIQNDLDIIWLALTRLEKGFSQKIFEIAYKSGCRSISCGIESGCQRILNLMNKGIKLEIMKKVLKQSSNAGIWNNVFVIFNFPTETKEEAKETINFVFNNKDSIDSINFTEFMLEHGSDVYKNLEKYSIKIIFEKKQDFGPTYNYISEKGMNKKEIKNDVFEFLANCIQRECIFVIPNNT